MHVSDYARAAAALIHEGKPVEIILTNLKRTLERRGARSLYVPVLRALSIRLKHMSAAEIPRVILARPSDHEHHKVAITASLREMHIDADSPYDILTDDTLVGGYVIEAKHSIIDKSYKKQLLALYRSLKS